MSIKAPLSQSQILNFALVHIWPAMAARAEKDFRWVVGIQIFAAQKTLPKLGAAFKRPAPSNDMNGVAANRISFRFSFIHAIEISAHDARLLMLPIDSTPCYWKTLMTNPNNTAQEASPDPINEAIGILTTEAASIRESYTPGCDQGDWSSEPET